MCFRPKNCFRRQPRLQIPLVTSSGRCIPAAGVPSPENSSLGVSPVAAPNPGAGVLSTSSSALDKQTSRVPAVYIHRNSGSYLVSNVTSPSVAGTASAGGAITKSIETVVN